MSRQRAARGLLVAVVFASVLWVTWRMLSVPSMDAGADEAAETSEPAGVVFELAVVRGERRSPMPGIDVSWLHCSDHRFPTDAFVITKDLEPVLRRFGSTARTDQEGRVRIEAPRLGVAVVARSGDLYGQTQLSERATARGGPIPAELELRRDETLVLRAVDPDGAPVEGVRLSFWGTTDSAGLLRIPHLQLLGLDRALQISAQGLVESPPVTEIDLSADLTKPIDVRVPPHGRLDVTVLGPGGQPWSTPPGTELTAGCHPVCMGLWSSFSTTITLDRDGRGTSPPVPLGRLSVSLWNPPFTGETIDGPERHGDRVAAVLRMPPETPVVAGRVVDADGRALRGVLRLWWFDGESFPGFGQRVGTDGEGRFRLALTTPPFDAYTSVHILLERDGASDLVGRIDLPQGAGQHDLGDVTLAVPPVLVAGRLSWPDGRPVDPPPLAVERSRRSGVRFSHWEPAPWLSAERTGTGEFVVRGLARDVDYRLKLGKDAWQHAAAMRPVPFEPGATDLDLRVAEACQVRAEFSFDETVPSRAVQFRLMPCGDPHLESIHPRDAWYMSEPYLPPYSSTRARSWPSLVPGRYRLSVHSRAQDDPLFELDDLEVRPYAQPDPRLVRIDLRDRIKAFTVRAVAPDRSQIEGSRGSAVLVRGRAERGRVWFGRDLTPGADGVTFVASRPLDLIVVAPGYRTRTVDAVSSDTAVSMEPAPGIAFELAGTAPALPANVRLIVCVEEDRSAPPVECELVREHGASTHYFPEGALALLGYGLASLPLEGRRTESWPVRTAGTRELRVLLRLSVEGQRPKTAKVSVRPTEVDLGACTDGQMVTLHIEDGAIERALGEVWN